MKKILFFFFLAGIISSKAVLLKAAEPAENKLMQVEGVFITDIFSDSMENRINEAVLNRLDGEILSILNASKIWLHFDSHYNQKGIDFADEIFKKRDSLILAGADLSKNSGGIMGIFFSCLFRDLKQGANAAFANSFGGGLYAMKEVLIDRNSVFLKGNASFSIQNYESERNYIDTPYGFFNLKSPMKTSLFQGAFYADYFYSGKTKFFTGADLSILTNENTQEKISNSGQIEIDGISNIRISALLGFESGKKYENTDLDFGFYLRRAVYGEQAEVAVRFDASKSKIQLLSGAEGL
ncbi:MAG: hypothetical protein LBH29_02310, partial [Elusimicrobiota bacterium]|nr:hypothetical protein [Elusimicrobiota bacterium]